MDKLVEWLLQGPPWVQYRTQLDLLDRSENASPVCAARQAMVAHPQIQALLIELAEWPGLPLKRHNDASHLLHKLTFVADLGLRADDPDMNRVIPRILSHQSREGPFQILVNILPRYGGTGQDQRVWMLCDAPLVLYTLVKLGLKDAPQVQAAARYLTGLVRENGWPCAVAPELGKFRGPGRKDDPCPYATLVMLKALAQMPEWRDSAVCRTGAETMLRLWEQRKISRPYLFAMGTDFAKLKAPLIWYDILHVLAVLTQFPWLQGDPRLKEMTDVVKAKADEQGRFTPESTWMAWKGWEFGQKRDPSRWLTLLARQVLKRVNT